MVISGRPTLRTIDAERRLEPGEVVACPTGRAGAHRLDNRESEPARVLVVSTMISPEINEYPDSGKLWARSSVPGADPGPDDVELIGRPGENLDIFEGETD